MTQSPSDVADKLRTVIGMLNGTRPWRSRAGCGTGSIFTMEFGPHLSVGAKQGEFSLMVYCAWRIVLKDRLLVSWHDDSERLLAPGLQALEGVLVINTVLSPCNDLSIRFADGRELHIINDFSPHADFDTSWFVIYEGKEIYSIDPNNTVTRELCVA